MKKILIYLISTMLAAAECLWAQNPDTHSCKLPDKPNIVDYFAAALPYIHPCEQLMQNAMKVVRGNADTSNMLIDKKIVDLGNGYISVTLGRNEDMHHMETCYWNMSNSSAGHKRALLGVYFFSPAEDSSIRFFEFDRTAKTIRTISSPFTLPSRFEGYDMQYELPRTGKTIKAWTYGEVTQDGDPMSMELIFNGSGFDVKFTNKTPEIQAFPIMNGNEKTIDIYRDGERCTVISDSDAECTFLTIDNPRNGWWHIKNAYLGGDDIIPMDDVVNGKIEYKNVGMEARNYDGSILTLRSHPSADAKVVFSIGKKSPGEEYYPPILQPIDLSDDGKWVKVVVNKGIVDADTMANNGGIGWIEATWLCGNPLTNCN